MKAEETLQLMFDNYPLFAQTREMLLIYIFCHFGTGFEWEEGELVSLDIFNKSLIKKVSIENNIAAQKMSYNDMLLKVEYDTTPNLRKADNFEVFLKNFLYDDTNKDIALKHIQQIFDDMKSVVMEDTYNMLSKEYSPILNIPEDIKPDWNLLYLETLDVLKEMNFSLDSEKIR